MFHVVFIEVSVQFSCIDDCYLIVPFLGLVKFISGSQNLKSACLKEGFFCEPSVWGSLQHYALIQMPRCGKHRDYHNILTCFFITRQLRQIYKSLARHSIWAFLTYVSRLTKALLSNTADMGF